MTNIINLSSAYGYTQYRVSGLEAGTIVNAGDSTWIHDNNSADGHSNPYPFAIYKAPDVVLDGGTIMGNIDLTTDWRTVYDFGNAAAIRTEDTPNVVIRDWRITDTWDAVRVSWNSPNFLIERVWVTDARDDAVENDRLQSGTIRDCLFDGVFSGVSVDPDSANPVDGHNNTVTLDGVLMRMKSFLYEGELTHSSMIKTDSATNGAVTPHLRFINTVFAIEDVQHHSYRSMFDAWAHTVESHGNVFLNLSDTPLPSGYPTPPAGWTILQGQAARDYWQQAKTEWIAEHPGIGTSTGTSSSGSTPTDPPPVTPPPGDTTPTDVTATFSTANFAGTTGNDTAVGNALANTITMKNGDDLVAGGAGDDTIDAGNGADTVSGNAGKDVFVFARGGDMDGNGKVDLFTDFEHGVDRFDLRPIDANTAVTGDQAFAFIGEAAFSAGKPGQLRAAYDSAKNVTVVQLSTDNDAGTEYFFNVAGKHAFTAADFML
ncbi:M10 family metallopeptidase C-terminal domain-containing protein [Falsiroseomonas sp. HW251]|uniref:M10 family metallopeptidase C-terminal domain-containing protein n=1 Tax=Falsiroseomonas sp. HW251 TaxID=3390998 RepID=UPI003D32365A